MLDHIHAGIYISGQYMIRRSDEIWDEGIQAVLRLDHSPRLPTHENTWDDRFSLLHLPINDAAPIPEGALRRGTAFIHEWVTAGQKVLVHCQMGISRSPSFVIAYLIEYEEMSLRDAMCLVSAQHFPSYPHAYLLLSLTQEYQLPYCREEITTAGFIDRLLE